MARSAGTNIQNSFVQGLITEATGINFPENACTETFDCIHNINGSIETRAGIDFEPNYGTKTIDRSGSVVVGYLWKNVAGNGDTTFLVVQIGNTIHFYNASSTQPVSNFPVSDTISLTQFSPSGAPEPKSEECQFDTGNGILFVSHPHLETFYVEYDPDTTGFTATAITLQIRDFEGVNDNLDIDERPNVTYTSLSQTHKYNLLNQGWSTANLQAWTNGGQTLGTDGTYSSISGRTDMPSSADVMWSFKNRLDVFDIGTVNSHFRGNSPAPKGHFVLDLYDQNRTAASGVTADGFSTGYERCSTVAFFQGRLFYSGLGTVGYNSKIFFSPIIERVDQYGQCYQANDPTSDVAFDLLPSDGGVIQIQEAGSIIKLFTTPGGLLVFATNGVWLLSGSTGLGFTANDYNRSRISAISSLTPTSFVDAGGVPIWWNLDGIYTVASTQAGGMQVQSLTMQTIQSFYDDIPPSSKRHAHGSYNPINGLIQWCYNSEDAATIEELYEPDRILNYNTRTNSFYVWTNNHPTVKLHTTFVVEQLGGTVTTDTVIDTASETVVDDAGDEVIVYTINNGIVTPRVKYLVSYASGGSYVFTVAEVRDETNWVDFYSYDSVGNPYSAYFVSGYKVHGGGLMKFQPVYIQLFTKNDFDTQYQFQTRWNYANSADSGKWSNSQSVSHVDWDSDYSTRRLKVRGSGVALQYKISQVAGYPFKLAGWATLETANQTV